MNTSINNYDPIEQIIFSNNLKIENISFHHDLGLIYIVLNNGKILTQKTDTYKLLKSANRNQLENYTLIGNGVGIHWAELDEDLSLKGMLKDYFESLVKSPFNNIAA